jgi:hypothetical protein
MITILQDQINQFGDNEVYAIISDGKYSNGRSINKIGLDADNNTIIDIINT